MQFWSKLTHFSFDFLSLPFSDITNIKIETINVLFFPYYSTLLVQNIYIIFMTNHFHLWIQIVSEIRKTMESLGFIEVETPVLQVCFFAFLSMLFPQNLFFFYSLYMVCANWSTVQFTVRYSDIYQLNVYVESIKADFGVQIRWFLVASGISTLLIWERGGNKGEDGREVIMGIFGRHLCSFFGCWDPHCYLSVFVPARERIAIKLRIAIKFYS